MEFSVGSRSKISGYREGWNQWKLYFGMLLLNQQDRNNGAHGKLSLNQNR